MRALRVVGITEGGGELSVVLEDSSRQERFTVPADVQALTTCIDWTISSL